MEEEVGLGDDDAMPLACSLKMLWRAIADEVVHVCWLSVAQRRRYGGEWCSVGGGVSVART